MCEVLRNQFSQTKLKRMTSKHTTVPDGVQIRVLSSIFHCHNTEYVVRD